MYVHVAIPPILQRGKTHKGDKLMPQEPTTKGPFTLTCSTNWQDFLDSITDVTGIEKENLQLDGMSWSFQKQK